MKVIRDRLGLGFAPERGLSLIEVMVAMFIFGLVSLGLIYTMISVLSVTRDSRVRQVAANLAAQEVDLARDIEDVANYGGGARTAELNGDTFTITRTSTWVTNPDTTVPSCGTTGGTLRYKQIHVEVTWGGMRGDTGVISDTLINPNERVTHPDFGTIMVTVQNSVPAGFADVTVNARVAGSSPTSTVITSAVTDANGCAYLLKVPPGAYDLTIEGASGEQFISAGGGPPLEVTTAIAGEASAVLFDVDLAATLSVHYVNDGAAVGNDQLPLNLGTSVISTATPMVSYRDTNASFPKIAIVPGDSVTLVAGDVVGCAATDPQQWAETTTQLQGERIPAVTADSGDVVDVNVPVRLVRVDEVEDRYVTAVSQNEGPGCATTITLKFSKEDDDEDRLIALPYGHWDLFEGSFFGSTSSQIDSSDIDVFGNDSKDGRTVILEPRVNKP